MFLSLKTKAVLYTVILSFSFQSVSYSRDKNDEKIPTRITPVLYLLFLGTISIMNLKRKDAVEMSGFKPNDKINQMMKLKNLLSLVRRLYGEKKEWDINEQGPINNFEQYVHATDPVRTIEASTVEDEIRQIEELVFKPDFKPAFSIPIKGKDYRKFFSDDRILNWAQIFDAEQNSLLIDAISDTSHEDNSFVHSMALSMINAFLGFIKNPRGYSIAAHYAAEQLEGYDIENTLLDLKTKPPEKERTYLDKTHKHLEKRRGEAVKTLKTTANIADHISSISDWDKHITKYLVVLDEMETPALISAFKGLERQINQIVYEGLESIGTQVIDNPGKNLKRTIPGKVGKILKSLLDQYMHLIPSPVVKDIMMDLIRNFPQATQEDLFGIVVRHFGPILLNILQTQAHLKSIGELAKVFENTQDKGLEIPIKQAYEIIKNDPNQFHTQIANFGQKGSLTPLGCGKLYCVYSAVHIDGTEVILRVRKPNIEQLLDAELQLLDRMAPQLAELMVLDDGSDTGYSAPVHRVRRLIHIQYRNLKKELNLPQTEENQKLAALRYTRSYERTIARGKVRIKFDVPETYPVKEKSEVMMQKKVTKKDQQQWITDNPDVAKEALSLLYNDFLQEALFRPLRQNFKMSGYVSDPNEVEQKRLTKSFIHRDFHGGNILQDGPSIGPDGMEEYTLHLIDYGLVTELDENQQKNIALLVFGATYNHAGFISEALWNLQEGKKASEGMYKNISSGKTEKNKSWGDVLSFVKSRIRQLSESGEHWSASQWIEFMWFKEFMDFPDSLIGIEHAMRALTSTYYKFGNTDEDMEKILKTVAKEQGSLFFYNARKQSSWSRTLNDWPSFYSKVTTEFMGSCAVSFIKYVAPGAVNTKKPNSGFTRLNSQ